MTDNFTDIAPGNSTIVSISGKQIEVSGLPLRAIANVLMNYPALLDLLFSRSEQGKEITAKDILKTAPDAATDIILHGIKMQGNKKAREIADSLPGGEQLILIATILKRSIGEGGFAPLAEHVEELAEMVGPLQDVAKDQTSQSKMNSSSQLNG